MLSPAARSSASRAVSTCVPLKIGQCGRGPRVGLGAVADPATVAALPAAGAKWCPVAAVVAGRDDGGLTFGGPAQEAAGKPGSGSAGGMSARCRSGASLIACVIVGSPFLVGGCAPRPGRWDSSTAGALSCVVMLRASSPRRRGGWRGCLRRHGGRPAGRTCGAAGWRAFRAPGRPTARTGWSSTSAWGCAARR